MRDDTVVDAGYTRLLPDLHTFSSHGASETQHEQVGVHRGAVRRIDGPMSVGETYLVANFAGFEPTHV